MTDVTLNVDLANLFKVKEIKVVESLDFDALQETLKWVVAKLQSPGSSPAAGRLGKVEDDLAILLRENEQLKEKVKALQEQQNSTSQQLDTKLDKDQLPVHTIPEDLLSLPSSFAALGQRVSDLEAKPHAQSHENEKQKHEHATEETQTPAAQGSTDYSARIEALEKALQELQSALEHSHKPSTQTSDSSDDIEALKQAMQDKVSKEELDALRSRLDNKADRSELDAMLQGGAVSLGGSDGTSAPCTIELSEEGEADNKLVVQTINQFGLDIQAIRCLIVVLQERLNSKADQGALEELRGHADTLRNHMDQMQLQLDALQQLKAGGSNTDGSSSVEAQATGVDLGDIWARIRALEAMAADKPVTYSRPYASLSPAAADSAEAQVAAHSAAEAVAAEAMPDVRPDNVDDMLKDLYQRLTGKANIADLQALMANIRDLSGRLDMTGGTAALSSPRRISSGGRADPFDTPLSPEATPNSPTWGHDGATSSERLESLEAALAALRDALAAKADINTLRGLEDRLSDLALALAGKVDKAALDELRMRMAFMVPAAAADGDATGGGGGGGANMDALVQMLQGMVADKAGKAELEALRDLLGSKAGRDELESLGARLQSPMVAAASGGPVMMNGGKDGKCLPDMTSGYASRDDLTSLADQVGDLYAALAKLRREMGQLPRDTGFGPMLLQQQNGGDQDNGPMLKIINSLASELQGLKEQLDMVAHATNIIAVGLEPRSAASVEVNGQLVSGPMHNGSAAGKESRVPAGAYDRLLKLLGSKGINQKMDWFDPDVLNKMAQKIAAVDAHLKNPAQSRGAAPDVGLRDLEHQMKKMAREMRAVKDRLADTANVSVQAMQRMADGDHAMLSGKPLMGYRCLACDRPLEKLDERAGPHVPTYVMKNGQEGTRTPSRPGNTESPQPGKPGKKIPYDPAQRGPQTWYEDARGAPAEALPKEDVGPRLNPGGWRGNSQAGGPNTGLPNISTGRGVSGVSNRGVPSPTRLSETGALPAI